MFRNPSSEIYEPLRMIALTLKCYSPHCLSVTLLFWCLLCKFYFLCQPLVCFSFGTSAQTFFSYKIFPQGSLIFSHDFSHHAVTANPVSLTQVTFQSFITHTSNFLHVGSFTCFKLYKSNIEPRTLLKVYVISYII